MKKIKIFTFLLTFSILVSCNNPKKENSKNQKKDQGDDFPPNIIYIMSDDHAYQAISTYDSRLINTPNIDRLANEGVHFTNSFVTNSVSSPSRAVCLTGKFSHTNGLRDNHNVFDSTQQTFPKLLQEAGYQTAIIGKWHLKSEPTGFDYWQVLPDQGVYYQPQFITSEGVITENGYVTDIITDKTIEWLSEKRDKSKPFMIMCHHKAPHREWLPAQRHYEDLGNKYYPEPKTLFDDYKNRGTAAKDAEMRIKDHMGLSSDNKIPPEIVNKLGYKEFLNWYMSNYEYNIKDLTSEELQIWQATYQPFVDDFISKAPQGEDLTRWKYQRYMQDYLACIKAVDENVGRIYKYLEDNNLLDNTLIVYTSDNGFYLGEHGWFDKRFMYEESLKVPLIMRYPKLINAGSSNTALVQNIDYAETFLDLAGVDIPQDMHGKSLLPLINDNSIKWRDAIYYHYYEFPSIHSVKRHYGVRTDRYKLIHFYYDIDEWELYDLKNDPNELENVFNKKEYTDVKEMLMSKLSELMKQYGDSDELRNQILESDLKHM